MPVTFDGFIVGKQYERPELAKTWGFKDFHAIARGAVTPKDSRFIVLFITHIKQRLFEHYEDILEDAELHIDGETNHANDRRFISAELRGDEIHLFYRERDHMPFTYHGQVWLVDYEQHNDKPSRFHFVLDSSHVSI